MTTFAVHVDLNSPQTNQVMDIPETSDDSTKIAEDILRNKEGPIRLTDYSERALRELLVTSNGNVAQLISRSHQTPAELEYVGKVKDALAEEGRKILAAAEDRKNLVSATADGLAEEGCESPTKKRKLNEVEEGATENPTMPRTNKTAAQKRAEAEEKAEKARIREEQKTAREEKKKQQDEEKAKRKVEREEKQAIKAQQDAEKAAGKAKKEAEKAAEKAKIEEEKVRKERAQLRVINFFAKKEKEPKGTPDGPSRQGSLEPTIKADVDTNSAYDTGCQTDFEKDFPFFFLHAHTTLAQSRVNALTGPDAEAALGRLGEGSAGDEKDGKTKLKLREMFGGATKRHVKRLCTPSVKELVGRVIGSEDHPVDPTSPAYANAVRTLERVPVKFLKYREDVRPPYIGTFTKQPSTSVSKVCRNPFTRAFAMVDYEYDSEAEWGDDCEGEDIESDGEEDEEGDGEDDEMEDFIDDEGVEQQSPSKRKIEEDLKPLCTGIFFEEDHDTTLAPWGDGTIDMAQFRCQHLLPGVTGNIDPWSTKYWEKDEPAKKEPPPEDANAMAPPGQAAADAKSVKLQGSGKLVDASQMDEFKKFVLGRSDTKLGMIESLKQHFPDIPKATLANTLNVVAKRVGKTVKDARWVEA